MRIACSGWRYREFGLIGENRFISFNLKRFCAGTDKASGTTGAGGVCGELLFKQQPVVDIDRDNENASGNC